MRGAHAASGAATVKPPRAGGSRPSRLAVHFRGLFLAFALLSAEGQRTSVLLSAVTFARVPGNGCVKTIFHGVFEGSCGSLGWARRPLKRRRPTAASVGRPRARLRVFTRSLTPRHRFQPLLSASVSPSRGCAQAASRSMIPHSSQGRRTCKGARTPGIASPVGTPHLPP